MAEAGPQWCLPCVRPYLSPGHARQGRAERADLSEYVLSAQPADRETVVSIWPDRQEGDRFVAVGQTRSRVCFRRHEPFRDRREFRPRIRGRIEAPRQGLSHLNPPE